MAAPLFSPVHHVAVICSDYERSKRFCTETLGFAIQSQTEVYETAAPGV